MMLRERYLRQLVTTFRGRMAERCPGRSFTMSAELLPEDNVLQLEVKARYSRQEDPRVVDECIREAAEDCALLEHFECVGAGTNLVRRIRDNTFWAPLNG